jgi:hypothetical protein
LAEIENASRIAALTPVEAVTSICTAESSVAVAVLAAATAADRLDVAVLASLMAALRTALSDRALDATI